MIVRRVFGEPSRLISFCIERSDRSPAISRKLCSDQHTRLNSTVSKTDSSLDTEVLLQKFVNYERQGVPDSAGTSGNKAFDLVRPSFLTGDDCAAAQCLLPDRLLCISCWQPLGSRKPICQQSILLAQKAKARQRLC